MKARKSNYITGGKDYVIKLGSSVFFGVEDLIMNFDEENFAIVDGKDPSSDQYKVLFHFMRDRLEKVYGMEQMDYESYGFTEEQIEADAIERFEKEKS